MQFYWRNLLSDVILNKAKDYYKNDKGILREQARDKTYPKKKKMKRENMAEKDFMICLKKRNKD